uniref:Uncharacterized protein n=1 Tax=Sphaerodactylus townsendi TaxID=933632 RepID=A0ACB8FPH0_9SAUR
MQRAERQELKVRLESILRALDAGEESAVEEKFAPALKKQLAREPEILEDADRNRECFIAGQQGETYSQPSAQSRLPSPPEEEEAERRKPAWWLGEGTSRGNRWTSSTYTTPPRPAGPLREYLLPTWFSHDSRSTAPVLTLEEANLKQAADQTPSADSQRSWRQRRRLMVLMEQEIRK